MTALRTHPSRILLVDDETNMLISLADLLEQHGYEVCGAASGPDALRLLSKDRFDALIVDLVMPDMSGLQVLEKAKSLRPGIRAILFSGYLTEASIPYLLRCGADDVICKPFDPAELVRRVNSQLVRGGEPETGTER